MDEKCDSVFISQAENRRYLSGFTGSAGYLIITHAMQVLATDFRYVEQAKQQAPDFDLRQISGEVSSWFPKAVEGLGIKHLAFESGDITFHQHQKLKAAAETAAINLEPACRMVENLRMIKEPEEVQFIRKAVALSDAAILFAGDMIKPGLTELELAWAIERYMRENGSSALPFEVIVASGPNAALPHAHPSDRQIKRGEPVIIDIGARVGGYASDLTRTLCAGKAGARFKEIYGLVLKAQTTAEEKIRAGMSGQEADSCARAVIESAGYGDKFGHGLGHGLGLAIHEDPRLGPNSEHILGDDMVFTIEPGVYIPGWGGVRIEDTVLLKNGRVEILTDSKK
jgi:Xaa-Pro aminopeptidase